MRILVDFDNTIADSSRCVFEIYKKETGDNTAQYSYNHGWNFEELIPEHYTHRAVTLFNEKIFFENLKPITDAVDVLKRLSSNHEIIIVTKAEPQSVFYKSNWIKEHLPFIKSVIYLEQSDFNKGMIKGDIIIDDYS